MKPVLSDVLDLRPAKRQGARMRHVACSFLPLVASLFLANGLAAKADTLTYADLVGRLTDMEHLAVLPQPGEIGALASSYDRASQYDAAKDQYINWGANGDGGGCIREEGSGQVMAEIQGPGCIWRTWSADPKMGHVRIYLDGSTTPAVDLPFRHFFASDGPFGAWPHLVYGQPSDASSGANNFVPMPFQKSCKIVGDKGNGTDGTQWGGYFQFTYSRFPAGTVVPNFKLPISDDDKVALTQADKRLADCAAYPPARPGEKLETKTVTVEPGKYSTALDLDGSGAITGLKIKTTLPENSEAQRTFLRQLTIRITWDGAKEPAVWAPLGDFFGTIGGAGSFKTLPVGLTDDGTFYSQWYMPFGAGAKIELGNDSPTPVTFEVKAMVAPLDKPLAALGRFHAKWHRDAFLPERRDRAPDWTLVTTKGTGRFVGTMLHVWNPGGEWWGEGDEKFFVDGEKFPSTFGTGSEDFFSYAWGNPGRFVRPFHAQPLNQNNVGHVDDMRWFIGDNVPFQKSFEGCIEKYFPNAQPRENSTYANTAFWYLSADGTDPYVDEAPVDQRAGYWKRQAAYREPDAIEAESLDFTAARTQPRIEDMWGNWPGPPKAKAGVWSGDLQLAWISAPSEEFDMKLPVEKSGKYKIVIRPTKAPSYGIFQFGLDDKPLGSPIDLYDANLTPGDPVELGTVDLTAGTHHLKVTDVGKNAAQSGPIDFGLDYIKLVPVR
jgi:hypothetical protein